MLKKLIVDSIHRAGYLLVKRKDFIRPNNFRSLIEGYEQMLNETVAREHPIPENARRPQLLARLEGTEPGEAYYVIRALMEPPSIVDDYNYFSTGAKTAVDEFCAEQNAAGERYSLFVPNPRYGYFAVLAKKA